MTLCGKKISGSGFTLIELLVVVAIIGILGSFAFIQLNGTRTKAKATKIVQDLKAIEKAMILWGQDDNIRTWWLDADFGGDRPMSLYIQTTNLVNYLPKEPTYNGNSYNYDNDGDTYDANGDGCMDFSVANGVNLFMTKAIVGDNNVLTEVDRILDKGDGLTCGKFGTNTTNFYYKLGNNSADWRY